MMFSTLDGQIEIEKEEIYKTPSISPFDFVNAIHFTKQDMIVDEWSEKQYNPFVVNKALSFGPDTVIAANEMNSRPHIDKKLQYHFLINSIRPRKRYNKWIKAEKIEDLEMVKQYYNYNTEKAQHALKILSSAQLKTIRARLFRGGTDNDT